ncbi:MAG: HepT-like ribonuclease domain-containing protein [Acidimicrobiales bacterium]
MRRDLLLLGEMIEAADRAIELVTEVGADDLAADRLRRDALPWNFTVLGEAAPQIDPSLRRRFPEVPWSQPARLRNRIVHGCWSIDLEIVHTTATDLLPGLVDQLRRVRRDLEAG